MTLTGADDPVWAGSSRFAVVAVEDKGDCAYLSCTHGMFAAEQQAAGMPPASWRFPSKALEDALAAQLRPCLVDYTCSRWCGMGGLPLSSVLCSLLPFTVGME